MGNRIKVVFISVSAFTNRYLQDYSLDTLSKEFDFEYWDCSLISDNGFQTLEKIERAYVVTIHSLVEFDSNLKRLPFDTIITLSILKTKKNFEYIKYVSQYFDNVCEIHPNNIGLPPSNVFTIDENPVKEAVPMSISGNFVREIKSKLYKSDLVRLAIKLIFHPSEQSLLIDDYYRAKLDSLFTWYKITTDVDAKYRLNNMNVCKYMRYVQNHEVKEGNYIVYIDQYFPYHNELLINDRLWDANKIAKTHFKKINALFDKIERIYNCPIIIAAHPVSNYSESQFEGRELRKWCTEELVTNSKGVLMHTSTSIAYAMLANKPLAVICDKELQISPWGTYINELRNNGLYVVDIDNMDGDTIITIPPIPKTIRDQYMRWIAGGEINMNTYKDNTELLIENYRKIYQDMYVDK